MLGDQQQGQAAQGQALAGLAQYGAPLEAQPQVPGRPGGAQPAQCKGRGVRGSDGQVRVSVVFCQIRHQPVTGQVDRDRLDERRERLGLHPAEDVRQGLVHLLCKTFGPPPGRCVRNEPGQGLRVELGQTGQAGCIAQRPVHPVGDRLRPREGDRAAAPGPLEDDDVHMTAVRIDMPDRGPDERPVRKPSVPKLGRDETGQRGITGRAPFGKGDRQGDDLLVTGEPDRAVPELGQVAGMERATDDARALSDDVVRDLRGRPFSDVGPHQPASHPQRRSTARRRSAISADL